MFFNYLIYRRLAASIGVITAFFIFSFVNIYSQEEANYWYFGENAGITFINGEPEAVLDGSLDNMEGVSAISNSAGELLFYTNGKCVWNKKHTIMKNGFGLTGHNSATQSGVIVPKPGSNKVFYIFTVDEIGGSNGFRYSVVDVTKENGYGEITEKNILLHVPTTEKVTAVRHNNNKDIWVISHQWNTNAFYAYLVTEQGVSHIPVISHTGSLHSGNVKNAIGYLKASPTGQKLAQAVRDMNLVELFDFDKSTGKISNPRMLDIQEFQQPYGIEFSPDGSKLYVSYSRPQSAIVQIIIKDLDSLVYNTVHKNIVANDNFALQLGPDGRIYIAKYKKTYLSVIEKPNLFGDECKYSEIGVELQNRVCNLGLPTFIQSYFTKYEKHVDTVYCDVPDSYPHDFAPGVPLIDYDTTNENNISTIKQLYFRTDTVFNKRDFPIEASFFAVGIDEEGHQKKNPVLKLEEYYSNKLHPLLNYIFFENNSFFLSPRYTRLNREQIYKFNIRSFYTLGTLNIYYHILNIIGKRMNDNSRGILTIVGCNSGCGSEENNLGLSLKRAETVRDYFIIVWGIPETRLKIEVRNLPKFPSVPHNEPEKEEENRRVEIYCNNPEILKPVFTSDTIRKTNLDKIRFHTSLASEAGITNYKLELSQYDKILEEFYTEDYSFTDFEWDLKNFNCLALGNDSPIKITMSAVDRFKQEFRSDPQFIEIQQVTQEKKNIEYHTNKEIDQFSLILFDFADSRISDENHRITEFIKSRIKPASKIEIFGYTDKTGMKHFNKNLSLKRAESIKNALNITNASVHGLGEEKLLYDNDTPEGRFYCRTVHVIMETPLNR